jgi:hypothetical protein
MLSLVMRSILTLLEAMVERKTVAQFYLGCQRVNPIPEDEKNDAF